MSELFMQYFPKCRASLIVSTAVEPRELSNMDGLKVLYYVKCLSGLLKYLCRHEFSQTPTPIKLYSIDMLCLFEGE